MVSVHFALTQDTECIYRVTLQKVFVQVDPANEQMKGMLTCGITAANLPLLCDSLHLNFIYLTFLCSDINQLDLEP